MPLDQTSYTATPADMEFAAAHNAQQRPTPADPILSDEHLAAEASNPTDTIELANGATLQVIQNRPAEFIVVGAADPDAYVTSTKLDALQRDADFLVERLNTLTDPATGQPRAGYEQDHDRLVLQLHQVQRTAAYEQTLGEQARRAANSRAAGLAQLQAEAEYQDRRTANAQARAFDEMFSPVRIA